MKNRNMYKMLLLLVAVVLLVWFLQPHMEEYLHSSTEYIFTIQSDGELSEEIVNELGKLGGFVAFYPVETYFVTLGYKGYTMPVELQGVEFGEYPLVCKADGTIGVRLGNQPVLLVGDQVWKGFVDSYGHSMLTDQIKKLSQEYRELSFSMHGESDQMQTQTTVGALLAEEEAVYIDKNQLEHWLSSYGKNTSVRGGCLKIRGLSQVRLAKERLSEAGLSVGEWSAWK